MKILVLVPDPGERLVVQQTLEHNQHPFTFIETSEQAWPLIQAGEANFLIGDWDGSDMRSLQFVPRARDAKLPDPLYILLIKSGGQNDEDVPSGVDDVLPRPFTSLELKNHLSIGERILSLASNLAKARDQLHSLAMFDGLTGLMNSNAFYRQAVGELERARRASVPLSLIALGIDNLKAISDAHGNEVGNEVVCIVARTLRERSRPYDCIGRWSGDEFVIMLAGVVGADAEKIAERVIAGVRSTRIEVGDEPNLNLKLSAGIASASRIGASTEVGPLIEQARQAMSRAREAGGNQVYLAYV